MSSKKSSSPQTSYTLDPAHTDPKRLKKEREKARILKNSLWWRDLVSKKTCHYCEKKFSSSELTMDHVIPLARGGVSVKGNIVPACSPCNRSKKLESPTDALFRMIEQERVEKEVKLAKKEREDNE